VSDGCGVRIVGLGSPHGDDRAGWAAIATLGSATLPPGVELRNCTAPATELLPALRGARRVILVDAVAGDEPGTILRGDRSALTAGGVERSSHGIEVGTLLDLADACGLLPPELTWVGVTVDPARTRGESFSAPVAAALPALARAAIEEALR
jgi:hydrogenase maturation protease